MNNTVNEERFILPKLELGNERGLLNDHSVLAVDDVAGW